MEHEFYRAVTALLETLEQTQREAMERGAQLIYQKVSTGGRFYATGTGHSHMLAEEFYARAGGLAFVRMIAPPEFTLDAHPMKSTLVERIPEYAQVILTQYPVGAGDVILIASNSGRNGLIVELALQARARGAAVIAITSLNSAHQSSRHPSGKLLADVADIVLDNCGVCGDSAIPVGDSGLCMGSTSTIAGAYIVQRLSILVAEQYLAHGEPLPVLRSSNVDGADLFNRELFRTHYSLEL